VTFFETQCIFNKLAPVAAPVGHRPETLLHSGQCVQFYNPGRQNRRPPPPKKNGAKTCKIWYDFGQLQTSIANISGTDRDIQNRKDTWSTAIPPAFGERKSGELWSTNNKVRHVSLDPPKSTFIRKTIFRPLAGAASSNLYTR